MGKYLFFDIDGTLIGPSKRVTKNTEEGIKNGQMVIKHFYVRDVLRCR